MPFVVNTANNDNFEPFLAIAFSSAPAIKWIFENSVMEIDQLADPIGFSFFTNYDGNKSLAIVLVLTERTEF